MGKKQSNHCKKQETDEKSASGKRRETVDKSNGKPRADTQECVIEAVDFYIMHFKNGV